MDFVRILIWCFGFLFLIRILFLNQEITIKYSIAIKRIPLFIIIVLIYETSHGFFILLLFVVTSLLFLLCFIIAYLLLQCWRFINPHLRNPSFSMIISDTFKKLQKNNIGEIIVFLMYIVYAAPYLHPM